MANDGRAAPSAIGLAARRGRYRPDCGRVRGRPDGGPTSNAEIALRDERTGEPVENPDHALWLQSMTLQTALMQAYMASRLAVLTVAVGGAFLAVGAALAAAGAARR